MDTITKLLEIARRSNREAIGRVYRSRDGKLYEFDDCGKLRGEYKGELTCAVMPAEYEEQIAAARDV